MEKSHCEECNSDKDVITLTKDDNKIILCDNCFDKEYLYHGWKHEHFEICEECDCLINCLRNNVYIISKMDKQQIWCGFCFDELWEDAFNDGWGGDDIENQLEH